MELLIKPVCDGVFTSQIFGLDTSHRIGLNGNSTNPWEEGSPSLARDVHLVSFGFLMTRKRGRRVSRGRNGAREGSGAPGVAEGARRTSAPNRALVTQSDRAAAWICSGWPNSGPSTQPETHPCSKTSPLAFLGNKARWLEGFFIQIQVSWEKLHHNNLPQAVKEGRSPIYRAPKGDAGALHHTLISS